MRIRKQETTLNVRPRVTLGTGWWRGFGILCLQLCLFCAMASRAQDEQPSAKTVKFTTLVNFDKTNGEEPGGALVQGRDGDLYGTTIAGGTGAYCSLGPNQCGTVFKITPEGALTTLYNFCSQTSCADGGNPTAGLVLSTDGNFYGVTTTGGTGVGCYAAGKCGTAFKITPSGALTTLYNWCSQPRCTDGFYGSAENPGTFVQAIDGNFYGANGSGGAPSSGTAFKLTPSGALTTLYTFCAQSGCADGATPSGLIQATNGNFYGTTNTGGAYGGGTVFKIKPGGTLATLYNFCSQTNCTDGGTPNAPLIQATDGNFYGSTTYGGANVNSASCVAQSSFCGTVFEITASGTLTTLYNFCSQTNCTDGSSPQLGLVQATDGSFYGGTYHGSPNTCFFGMSCGTVFKMTPGGMLTTLHSFDSTDGEFPVGLVPTGQPESLAWARSSAWPWAWAHLWKPCPRPAGWERSSRSSEPI